MVAAAVALQAGDVPNTGVLSGVLIASGGHVIVGGIDVTKQTQIHAAAMKELSDSFAAEMRPTIMELEGKQYELTGTASEQYREWKDLLRRIYYEETGFGPDAGEYDVAGPSSAETPASP